MLSTAGRVLSDPADYGDDEESLPQSPMTLQDGVRAVQQAFGQASPSPRWPMYVRQAKQFLRSHIEGFDERKYGFASVVDLLRAAAKEGVLKLERDRHGAFRVFAGARLNVTPQPVVEEPTFDVAGEVLAEEPAPVQAEPIEESPIVDVQPFEEQPTEVAAPEEEEAPSPARKTGRKRKAAAAKPARPRARKTTSRRAKSEAADR